MAIAVSLWFDPALEAEVRTLWADLARAGITDGLHAGPYRPHVTLGTWESMAVGPLVTDLRRLAAGAGTFEIAFAGVDVFEDGEGVVFLRPHPDAALAALHARVHAMATPTVPARTRANSRGPGSRTARSRGD